MTASVSAIPKPVTPTRTILRRFPVPLNGPCPTWDEIRRRRNPFDLLSPHAVQENFTIATGPHHRRGSELEFAISPMLYGGTLEDVLPPLLEGNEVCTTTNQFILFLLYVQGILHSAYTEDVSRGREAFADVSPFFPLVSLGATRRIGKGPLCIVTAHFAQKGTERPCLIGKVSPVSEVLGHARGYRVLLAEKKAA